MPKWLIKSTLKELDKVDKQYEKGKISHAMHNYKSRQIVEKALAIEKNITKKEIRGKF